MNELCQHVNNHFGDIRTHLHVKELIGTVCVTEVDVRKYHRKSRVNPKTEIHSPSHFLLLPHSLSLTPVWPKDSCDNELRVRELMMKHTHEWNTASLSNHTKSYRHEKLKKNKKRL